MTKNFIFNDNEETFFDSVKSYIQKKNKQKLYKILFKNDKLLIFKDDIIVEIIMNKIKYKPRTFSIAENLKYSLQIQVINNIDIFIDEMVEKICCSYSSSEIKSIINDMPLLNEFSTSSVDLSEYSIIWRDHFLEENIGLLNSFVKMGIKPHNILALDKGDSTKHRKEITETFKSLGYQTRVMDNAFLNIDRETENYKTILSDFLKTKNDKKVIILDDGAIVTGLLEDNLFKKILFAVELTEMGLRRIKKLKSLPCKIYNLAKSDLKKLFTYKEVASSVFYRIMDLLGAKKTIGRTVIILGYGDLGSMLAKFLRDVGLKVVIVDLDYKKLILAAENGFETYKVLSKAINIEQPFLVVGTSGYYSITYDDLLLLPNNTYVTSAATADVKIFENIKDSIHSEIIGYGRRYLINNKYITLLGNGRSINLYDSEAIPNQSNDLFKAATLLTVINGIQQNSSDKTLDLDIVNEWLDKSNIYKSYYNRYISME